MSRTEEEKKNKGQENIEQTPNDCPFGCTQRHNPPETLSSLCEIYERTATPDSHSVPDMVISSSSMRSFLRSAAQSHRLNISVAAADKLCGVIYQKIDVVI